MYAVIRLRGEVGLKPKARETLRLLRLERANHLVFVPEGKENRGMIEVVRHCLTYGEISEKTLAALLERRGRLAGNRKLDKEFLKAAGFKEMGALAKAIIAGKKSLMEMGVKPVFRLRAPTKGYERAGIKKDFSVGGALGYRGAAINALIERMLG